MKRFLSLFLVLSFTSWFATRRADAAEYPCASVTPALLPGKTVWLDVFSGAPPFETSGSYRLILNANGTYSIPSPPAMTNHSGTWGALVVTNMPPNPDWTAIHLTNYSATSTNFAVMTLIPDCACSGNPTNVCAYELHLENEFTSQGGYFRITDGEAPAPQAPQITLLTPSTTNLVGTMVTLEVTAAGSRPLFYQWFKTNSLLAGQTNSTLTFSPLQLSDAGTYKVTVSNSVNSITSSNIVLGVDPGTAPSITQEPPSQNVLSNQSVSLSVSANGTQPLAYQWRKDGAMIGDTANRFGTTNSTLLIFNFAPTDEGGYTVLVTNNYGAKTSAVATLTIIQTPMITLQPVSMNVLTGQTFTLTVMASGLQLDYQWFRFTSPISGATNDSYSITNAIVAHSADYSVRVSNPVGSVTSVVAHVEVYSPLPPSITGHPTNVTINTGDSTTFRVIAYGYPPINFTWRKDATNIPGQIGLPPAAVSNFNTFYSYFTVSNAVLGDAGIYSAVASNAYGGTPTFDATLTVIDAQKPVITHQPTNQTLYFSVTGAFPAQFITYTSSVPATVQWYSNGVAMAGQTAQSLNIILYAVGIYDFFAAVSNQFGVTTSATARVSLIIRPGTLDTNFLSTAAINGSVYALAPLPDGRVIAAGTFTSVGASNLSGLARFNTNGTLDSWVVASNAILGSVFAVRRQPDGRLLIGGDFYNLGAPPDTLYYTRFARLNEDGSLDTNFLAGSTSYLPLIDNATFDASIASIAVRDSDGAIAIGGNFTFVGTNDQKAFALFDSNGVFVSSFQPKLTNAPPGPFVSALAFQADGKLLIAGSFTNVNGSRRVNFARLNFDGSLDLTYSNNVVGSISNILIQPDGRAVIAGPFTMVGSVAQFVTARLSTNGVVDTNWPVAFNSTAQALAFQLANSNIVVGGAFNGGSLGKPYLARLNYDGTGDTIFPGSTAGGGQPSSTVRVTAFAPDGSLFIGGDFTTVGTIARSKLAKLRMESLAAAIAQPTLGAVFFSAGNLSFSIATQAGYSYEVQFKNSLSDPTWMTYQIVSGDGTTKIVSIPALADAAFFRVIVY